MEVDAIEVKGPLAFSRGATRGRIVPKDGSSSREIADRYLMVLRREKDGGWMIAVLMWGPITEAPK
jgi:ketosteroid isomerase-like protein